MKAVATQKNMVCASLILLGLILTGQCSAEIDKQSIAAIWLFDEGTGEVAKDISGNSNDGELVGSFEWVEGQFGKALDFDGRSYIEVPDSSSLRITDAITITAWVYKRLPHDSAGRGTILGKWYQDRNTWSYVLYDESDPGGGWRLRWADATQTNLVNYEVFPDEKWTHYAATYDGSDMKVFVNGKEVGTAAASKKIDDTGNPVWIGNEGYNINHFTGILDEVVLLSVALTVDDIKSIMTEGIVGALGVFPSDRMAFTWGNIKADPGIPIGVW